MRKVNKITIKGRTYIYEVNISPYYKVWEGNGDKSTIMHSPCHEHNMCITIHKNSVAFKVRRINCRVFYYLKNGVPSHHSCRYTYDCIVEARLQKFIAKLIS